MSLSTDLQAAISQLQTDHSSLVTAVRARNGVSVPTNTAIARKLAGDATIQAKVDSLRAAVAAAATESLSLDFINEIYQSGGSGAGGLTKGSAFSDLITLNRASQGSRWNREGKLEMVAAGQPRFDYDPVTRLIKGLLIEESRTNLNAHSAQISALSYAGSAIINPNAAVAPDGTLTASMVENTPSAGSYFSKALGTLVDGGTYTRSIYVKSNGVDPFTIIFEGVGVGTYTSFDVVAKIFSGAAGVSRGYTDVGNGWIRVSVTGVHTAGVTTIGGAFYIGGYPTNSAQHRGYVWGIQTEQGSFASSHIPTPASFTSRASSSLFFGANGFLQTAASNVARSDAYGYDSSGSLKPIGLLLERSSTNLLLRSSEFDNIPAWSRVSGVTVTPNVASGPDGQSGVADKLVSPATTGASRYIAQTLTLNSDCNFSFYAKKAELNFLWIGFLGRNPTASESKTVINLTTLAQGNIANVKPKLSVTPAGNGWIRISLPRSVIAGSTQVEVRLGMCDGLDTEVLTGDGTSGVNLWGAQLETGLVATSYIATTTAQAVRAADISTSGQVTRAADIASVNALSPWFNAANGTLFAEVSVSTPVAGVFNSIVGLRAASGDTSQISITRSGSSNRVSGFVRMPSGATQVDINALTDLSPSVGSKVALAYKQDSFSLSKDGATAVADNAGMVPNNMAKLVIGATAGGTSIINGHIRSIKYFPRRLSNTELQALTA